MSKIKIVVPFYNVEKWILKTVKSIQSQNYKQFTCIIIDDMSNDNSYDICFNQIKNDDRFVIKRNTTKKCALQNIYEAIEEICDNEEDIIITVDGDDWLYDDNVLEKVVSAYEEKDISMTYGNFINYPKNSLGYCTRYSQHTIDNNLYRKDTWKATHLRTFKYKLWKNIKKQDLLDENGNFYDVTWDLAFMFPMLEMSGGKFHCFTEPLYVYNRDNCLNDEKIKLERQKKYDSIIRNKQSYQPLEKGKK